jgi:hypothetical protein
MCGNKNRLESVERRRSRVASSSYIGASTHVQDQSHEMQFRSLQNSKIPIWGDFKPPETLQHNTTIPSVANQRNMSIVTLAPG